MNKVLIFLAVVAAIVLCPRAIADVADVAYDAMKTELVLGLPGNHDAWAHAIDAASIQSGLKDGMDKTQGYATGSAVRYADDAGVTPYVGAMAYGYKVIRDRKASVPVDDPLLGKHRLTVGIRECSVSDVRGPMGFTQGVGVDTYSGAPKVTVGISRHW
jgi:hypothetical protein